MSTRDTRTGSVLELTVLPALQLGGYQYQQQVAPDSATAGMSSMRS
jgi:hypothetical protein